MPQKVVQNFRWTSNLAYAVGLLVTDGSLSSDGRHFDLTSKDIEQLENFKKSLNLKVRIGWKTSGLGGKKYPRVQFGDIKLYRWLLSIGLEPNKTKTIGELKIPDRFFFDFLRGHFDGDGCIYGYHDPRWKNSYMFYTSFISASEKHTIWLQRAIFGTLRISGKINVSSGIARLRFAKKESYTIIKKMYYNKNCICLSRKFDKVKQILKQDARVAER